MKIKKSKKALVLIYILFLVTIGVVFSTILINNNAFLFNISKYFDVDAKLYSNMNSDAEILVNINREVNSNGGGFVDNVSCPSSPGVTMSGTTSKLSGIQTKLVNSGSIYCESTNPSYDLKIFFNSGITELVEAEYDGYTTSLVNSIGVFGDGDNTQIDFSMDSYDSTPDDIDDDFDSDNYRVNSTGALHIISSINYPDGYQDDDVLGRKQIFGYVAKDFGFKKIFWNTPKVIEIIDDNYNNGDDLNIKMGEVTDGILYFDVDKDFDIKVVEFDKNLYEQSNELKAISRIDSSVIAGVGYLQENAGVLSLSDTLTGNEKHFDFQNKNYAIFLEATGLGTLLYKLKGETSTGSGIYITPIDDSDDNIVRFMGNEILISKLGQYISKETELIFEK